MVECDDVLEEMVEVAWQTRKPWYKVEKQKADDRIGKSRVGCPMVARPGESGVKWLMTQKADSFQGHFVQTQTRVI